MRILAISDEEAKKFYDYYKTGVLDEYDLILACGDLRRSYLEFLVTMAHCPLVYVPGNHDERMYKDPPEGCLCADDNIVVVNGLRILGLGGSHRYRPGRLMYTEREMAGRIRKLRWKLLWHRGFDILLTHAPARNLNDFDTDAHRGFECFRKLMKKYEPKLFVHGHVHLNYGMSIPRVTSFGKTRVINAFEYYAFDYPAEPTREEM